MLIEELNIVLSKTIENFILNTALGNVMTGLQSSHHTDLEDQNLWAVDLAPNHPEEEGNIRDLGAWKTDHWLLI